MPYKVDDERYKQRRRSAPSDAVNKLNRETAGQVARRLDYQAEQLTRASMQPDFPTHKHKWATGKEKWEAVQRAGAKTAGVIKTGKRGPKPASPAQQTSRLMADILSYNELVASGDPDGMAGAIRDSLVDGVNTLADILEPADLQLMRAALNM